MNGLNETARIFEASSVLQTAATALLRICKKQSISPSEKEAITWVGDFLPQVDWDARPDVRTSVSGELSVQATYVRPSFYAVLTKIEHALNGLGPANPNHISKFLADFYQFLQHGGSTSWDLGKLEIAAHLLEELSALLLIELTNNGVPRERELLTLS